jgi:hypothetical protein
MLDDAAGYHLYLGGGFIKSKTKLDEHLKLKWVDAKTRRLYVDFQMFTPDADLVTVMEIRMTTNCGFLYAINTDVSIMFSITILFIGILCDCNCLLNFLKNKISYFREKVGKKGNRETERRR